MLQSSGRLLLLARGTVKPYKLEAPRQLRRAAGSACHARPTNRSQNFPTRGQSQALSSAAAFRLQVRLQTPEWEVAHICTSPTPSAPLTLDL